ncbi:MAG: M14 family zinc carboxypeptidase [Planctomycetota bacterium]
MKTCSLTPFVAVLAVASLSLASAQDTLRRVRVDADDAEALAAAFLAEGRDVLEGTVEPGSLELVVSVQELGELERLGYAPELLEVGQPFRDKQAADGGTVGYPDLAQVYADMATYAATYPEIATIVDLTATYGTPPTVEGRHIFAMKISDNVDVDEDEPELLVVSCHHSRETVTPVIALTLMDLWLPLYGNSPAITDAIDEHELWVVPIWNPDGYVHVFEVDNLWRKNRRVFPGGIGVDLNRNYPQGWSDPCSGSTDPSSSIYKGPAPASEAETLTMMAFSEDRHFAKTLDFHSSGQEVLWGYACLPHPFDDFFLSEAIDLSFACGYQGEERRPSAEGEHYEWQFAQEGGHAFLVETATEFQPAFATAEAEAAQVLFGVLWMAQREVPISGVVTDACTGAPLEADVELVGVNFTQGESNESRGPYGRYHVFAPAGNYTLSFSRPGYATQEVLVTVTAGTPVAQDVALQAIASAAVLGPLQPGTKLTLDIGAPADANQLYFAAAGLSGTSPGIPVGGCNLPLNPDFFALLSAASQPPFSGFNGVLDGTGQAMASIDLPDDPVIAGLEMDLAFVTVDAQSGALLHPSNAAHATIQP